MKIKKVDIYSKSNATFPIRLNKNSQQLYIINSYRLQVFPIYHMIRISSIRSNPLLHCQLRDKKNIKK